MFRLLSAVVTTLAPFTVAAAGHSRNYHHTASLLAKGIAVRGGDRGSSGISRSNGVIIGGCESHNHLGRQLLSSKYITIRGGASSSSSSSTATTTEYVTLSSPASGSPFHYAFPVHNLDAAKDFYGTFVKKKNNKYQFIIRYLVGWCCCFVSVFYLFVLKSFFVFCFSTTT